MPSETSPPKEGHALPVVLLTALPETGHTAPLIQIAAYLVRRGYTVLFHASSSFEAQIRAAGAEFHSLPTHVTAHRLSSLAHEFPLPDGMDFASWYVRRLGIEPLAERYKSLVALLEIIRHRFPRNEVVIVRDVWSFHTLPLWYGAPLPRGYGTRPRIVGISTLFLLTHSVDVPPYFQEVPVVEVPSRERIAELWDNQEPWNRDMVQRVNTELQGLGCTRLMKEPWMFDEKTVASDVCLVACSRSLDLYRSDLQDTIVYAGTVPTEIDADLDYPAWWLEITANVQLSKDDPARKKLVVISQGTVNREYRHLLMPSLRALADRSDIITIALLGCPGARLHDDFATPANAHVLDYFPYEAILPYADAMISNAGFGSIMHGIMAGVPMVFGGNTEDKAEVSLRGDRAGIAINLQTATPTEDAVRKAVNRVLTEASFKDRAVEMMKENKELDFLGTVERFINKT